MNPAPENLLRAAGWLQTLNTKLIYVGGSVAPLYYQRSEFFGEERPTVDVDCVSHYRWELRVRNLPHVYSS